MSVTYIDPVGLPQAGADRFRQIAVAEGSRHVYIAGQVAYDAHGQLIGAGDLAAQVAQAYRNVATALASVGATFGDVVRLTLYVVRLTLYVIFSGRQSTT